MLRSPFKLRPLLNRLSLGAGSQAMEHSIADAAAVAEQLWATGQDVGNLETRTAVLEANLSGSSVLVLPALADFDKGQAVTAGGYQANCYVPSHARLVVGVAAESTPNGGLVPVISQGVIPLDGYAEGDTLWLGADGAVLNHPPASGFQLRIGLALSAGIVLIIPSEPIVLLGG